MSLELIYTSAAKGLKPGSRGFCTVAMTQGMPPQLVDRLEALSGYRQVFAPQDPQAGLNPVVCSHLRISVAGRNYHVLSRVCAAGLDYSQRTNKFAHHVVLDANELPPAGPAWLLAMPGFMTTAWDQTTRLLPPRPRPPAGNSAPAICQRWQQATGDAGWGGALIDAAIKNPRSMATLIFRPGQDPLPLLAESLALLPLELRWQATFSTYYTKLPPGVECRWRCVVEGSPEAKTAAGLVINLCHRLGQPPAGEYVTAARTGRVPTAKTPPRAISADAPDDSELAHLLGDPIAPPAAAPVLAPIEATDWPGSLQLPPSLPADLTADSGSTLTPRRFREKESAQWPYVVGLLAIALVMIGGGIAIWSAISGKGDGQIAQSRPGPAPKVTVITPAVPEKSNDTPRAQPAPKPADPPKPTAPPSGNSHASNDGTIEHAPQTHSDAPPPAKATGGPTPSPLPTVTPPLDPLPNRVAKKPPALPDPFVEMRNRTVTGIPEFKWHSSVGGTPNLQSDQNLGQINTLDVDKVRLELIGQQELTPGVQFTLDPKGKASSGPTKWWGCFYRDPSTQAAAFTLGSDGRLSFRWSSGISDRDTAIVNLLCNQLVRLTSSDFGQPMIVALRRPGSNLPLHLSMLVADADPQKPSEIPVVVRYLPHETQLRLQVLAPVRRANAATFKVEQKSNDEVTLAAECRSNLKMNLDIQVVKGNTEANPTIPPKIVAKYSGVTLDATEWSDLPMVKNAVAMLTMAQVEKHLDVLGGGGDSAEQLAQKLVKATRKLAEEKSKKEKDEKEIKRLTKEDAAAEQRLAARQLLDAMQQLATDGIRYRVFYQAPDKDGTLHDVDIVTVPPREEGTEKTVAVPKQN